jgi:prepilin-type N-terminal cleavage/methylation domain-containing protein
MIISKPGKTKYNRDGFTILEVLIAVAITGLLAAGLSVLISQLFNINANSRSHMTAIKQIEIAINRLSSDIQMAQIIEPYQNNNGFPLSLAWKDWDNTATEITYFMVGDELKRQVSLNGDAPLETVVASKIQSIQINTPPAGYSGREVSITISASVGSYQSTVESRTFAVLPRPGT